MSRWRVSSPEATAFSIALTDALASAGMSTTSAPASSADTAAAPPRSNFLTIAPMFMPSVTMSPLNPSLSRNWPVSTFGESVLGTLGSTSLTTMCAVMMAGTPALLAEANGTQSRFMSCSTD